MDNAMQVSYTLTFKEFRKLQRYYRWGTIRNRILSIVQLLAQLILSIFIGGLLIGTWFGMSWWVKHHPFISQVPSTALLGFQIPGALAIFLLIRLISFLRYRLRMWATYRKSAVKDGQTIIVSPEFFVSETKISKTEIKWNGVTRIIKKPDLVALFVEKRGAYTIPTRAFDSQEQLHNFLGLVDTYWNSHKP